MQLTIIHPSALPSINELPAGTHWFYADDDSAVAGQLLSKFGTSTRLFAPDVLQAKGKSLRAPFLAWTDKCLEYHKPEDWLASSMFKDIIATPMFLHTVSLVVIREVVERRASLIVVTSSFALARAVKVIFHADANIHLAGTHYFIMDEYRVVRNAILHWLIRPLRLLLESLLSNIILGCKHKKRLIGCEILVDVFLLPGDLNKDGHFADRYLPGLLDYYRMQNVCVVSSVRTANFSLFHLPALYRAMGKSETLFCPHELLILPKDIVAGQWRTMLAAFTQRPFRGQPFHGMDMCRVAGFWWAIATIRTVIPRVLTALALRMSSASIRPHLILNWYENQAIDKAVTIAFLSHLPPPKVVALRQFFPTKGMIGFFSTNGEVRCRCSPEENWVCGPRTAKLFSQHDSVGAYLSVPALRYANLYRASERQGPGNDLVIFMASALEEAYNILDIALADLKPILHRFTNIRIKPHQALNISRGSLDIGRWPNIQHHLVTWETHSSGVLLQSAGLVMTAGSSVALEALCMGVPVVVAGRASGLDLNPLEDVDPTLWRIVYNHQEFCKILEQWWPMVPPLKERLAMGMKIRDDFFEPVTESGMRKFLSAT